MIDFFTKHLFLNARFEGFYKELPAFLFAFGIVVISARLSSHLLILWGVLFYIFYNKRVKTKWNSRKYNILKIIIVASILNELLFPLIGDTSDISIEYIIPYSVLIIFTIALSEKVDDRLIKWLILLAIVEVLIGILELSAGVVSFWTVDEKGLIESDLLYDRKVYGIDGNSSGFAYRVIFAALLYHCYKGARVIKEIPFYCIVLVGLVISFNRTCLLAFMFFVFLIMWKTKHRFLLLTLPVLAIIYIVNNSVLWDMALKQLTRGDTDFSTVNALSERDLVYPFYFQYIVDNFFFGHGSFKYYADIFKDGRMFHAHNSYLQTLANNGVPISLLYFYLIKSNINKYNYLYIFPFLLMACFQCLILWGISLPDIVFYKFLFSEQRD